MEKAFFVTKPTTICDLMIRRKPVIEHAYQICAVHQLPVIDYDNFSNGLDVERQYLEELAHLCSDGDVYQCVLVKSRRHPGGILVLPDENGFVKCAALYIPEPSKPRPRVTKNV